MSKKKEPPRNLIAILSIIAAFVWTVVLFLWLSRNSSNFTNDLGIWMGSVGSIAAFMTVIFTTQKQINVQRKSLKKQIKAQKKNLQKQIDNQNRLENRPLLCVENVVRAPDLDFIEETYFELDSQNVLAKGKPGSPFPDKLNVFAIIENIGNGIAIEMAFF